MKLSFKNISKQVTIKRANIALLLIIAGFFVYILFAPLTPASFKTLNIKDSKKLEAGSQLTYSVYRCRYVTENVNTTVIRNLVATDKNGNPLSNNFTVSLSSDLVATPRGCSTTTRTVLLPSNVPEGYYRLRVVSIYQIIPIRKPTVIQIESSAFKIEPPTVSEQIEQLNAQLQTLRDSLARQGVNVPAPSNTQTTRTTTQTTSGGTGGTGNSNSGNGSSSSSGGNTTTPGGSTPTPNPVNPLDDIINEIQGLIGL